MTARHTVAIDLALAAEGERLVARLRRVRILRRASRRRHIALTVQRKQQPRGTPFIETGRM